MHLKTLRQYNFSLSVSALKEQTGSKSSVDHVIGFHGNINVKKDCPNKSNAFAKAHTNDMFLFEDRPFPLLF